MTEPNELIVKYKFDTDDSTLEISGEGCANFKELLEAMAKIIATVLHTSRELASSTKKIDPVNYLNQIVMRAQQILNAGVETDSASYVIDESKKDDGAK